MEKPEILILTERRLDLLKEILRVTKLVNLTGDKSKFEEETDDYVFLIEKRQKMFSELNLITEKIVKQPPDNKFQKEIDSINNQMKLIVKEIIDIDEKNNIILKDISSNIKGSIKNIKVSRNVNNAYNSFVYEGRGLFDTKQ